MSDEDRQLIREDLREIEKDLAFEVVEAYQGRRVEDFANALVTLQVLVEVVSNLCERPRLG